MASDIRAVVFDMDGVLVDTETVYERCWQEAAQKLNLRDIASVHRAVLGLSEEDTLRSLKAAYGECFDAAGFWRMTSEMALSFQKEHGVPLKPYAKEVLSVLSGKGYALALASSSARALVEEELSGAGLLPYFSVTVCGDEVRRSKPNPEIYARACDRLGVSCGNAVAVEDSANGIQSARSAGLRCVMVPDRVQPDGHCLSLVWHCLSSLKELPEIL